MATKQLNETPPNSPHKNASSYHYVSSPVKPSAPAADDSPIAAEEALYAHGQAQEGAYAAAPELLPPSARTKRRLGWLTLQLVPYHALNWALSTAAFCSVITGVSFAAALLPLCCIGVPIYLVLLRVTRVLVALDIALANTIARSSQATARWWNVPDELPIDPSVSQSELRIAPRLNCVSLRSTLVLLYFATVKFILGILSAVVVCLPFMPLAAEIVSHTAATDPTYVAGWNVHKFNFETHPVWFVIVFIVYVVGGVALMHVVGRLSRETTRRVCCVEVTTPPPL